MGMQANCIHQGVPYPALCTHLNSKSKKTQQQQKNKNQNNNNKKNPQKNKPAEISFKHLKQ